MIKGGDDVSRLLEYFTHKYPYSSFHELNADWLISAYKELIAEVDKLDEWKVQHEAEYLELKSLYDDIISGNFPESMRVALYNWVLQNSSSIIGSVIKMVLFDLTDDGYLVAYVPDSWADIIFGTTGLDTFPAGFDFGHLTISY